MVVGKVVKYGDLVDGLTAGDLTFNKVKDGWKITAPGSTAMLATGDNLATNGVVHVIDGVLLPKPVYTLLFYAINTAANRCGEVNAGPMMAAALTEKNPSYYQEIFRKGNINSYIQATEKYFLAGGKFATKQGTCASQGYTEVSAANKGELGKWAFEDKEYNAVCKRRCRCSGPKDCKDVVSTKACSMCGPALNVPQFVTFYYKKGQLPGDVKPNIVELASSTDYLSTLVTAVKAAGLVDTLSSSSESFTVFAPNNAAFAKVTGLDAILKDTAQLKAILLLHVVVGRVVQSGILYDGLRVGDLQFNKDGGGWKITSPRSSAKIITADVGASNGIIHVINGVLLPAPKPKNIVELASSTDYLSTLVTAVKAAGLVDTLSSSSESFTVFAPNNAAFAKVTGLDAILKDTAQLQAILLLHVLVGRVVQSGILYEGQLAGDLQFNKISSGWKVTAPGSTAMIITPDVGASNGVVHVIDGVLLPSAAPKPKNIVELASSTDYLSTLVTAVKAAGLVDTLSSSSESFTVFAPNNAAFAKVTGLDAILKDTAQLQAILRLHVLVGSVVQSGALYDGLTVGDLKFNIDGSGWRITSPHSSAKIITADISASNGVVHVIDSVLLPASGPSVVTVPSTLTTITAPMNIVALAASVKSLSTLVAAVKAAGLIDTLSDPGPFTVFAPNDKAFAAIPNLDAIIKDTAKLTKILLLHVVMAKVMASDLSDGMTSGDLTFVKQGSAWIVKSPGSEASIIQANIPASNGVVHVIDAVLLPADEAVATTTATAQPAKNIVEIASSVADLSTLVTAVKAAGLVEILSGPGPFTVFAPNNKAFEQVDGLDAILKDNQLLTKILMLHVVVGKVVESKALRDGLTVNTASGALTFTREPRGWLVTAPGSQARVNKADIVASNGIIHTIHGVLLPAATVTTAPATATVTTTTGMNVVQLASSLPKLSSLVDAVKAAGLVETLSGPGPFTVLAPTNDAFASVKGLATILTDTVLLTKVLLLHVAIGNTLMFANLFDNLNIDTTSGTIVFKKTAAGGWMVQNSDGSSSANIISVDNTASNGVVHFLDAVLLPVAPKTTTLTTANKASVSAIPGAVSSTPEPLSTPVSSLRSVVGVAQQQLSLTNFVKAVRRAGLVDTFSSDAIFTVFAPTNNAFASVNINAMDKAALVEILKLHVIAGRVMAADIRPGQMQDLVFSKAAGKLMVTNVNSDVTATITDTDVEASNGVIHMIDTLLVPTAPTVAAILPNFQPLSSSSSSPEPQDFAASTKSPNATPNANKGKGISTGKTDASTSDSGGSSTTLIIAIIATATALAAVVVGAVIYVRKKLNSSDREMKSATIGQAFDNPAYAMTHGSRDTSAVYSDGRGGAILDLSPDANV